LSPLLDIYGGVYFLTQHDATLVDSLLPRLIYIARQVSLFGSWQLSLLPWCSVETARQTPIFLKPLLLPFLQLFIPSHASHQLAAPHHVRSPDSLPSLPCSKVPLFMIRLFSFLLSLIDRLSRKENGVRSLQWPFGSTKELGYYLSFEYSYACANIREPPSYCLLSTGLRSFFCGLFHFHQHVKKEMFLKIQNFLMTC